MKTPYWKLEKKACVDCKEHQARFCFRGVVKYDPQHTLCPRCFRSQADSFRARSLAVWQTGISSWMYRGEEMLGRRSA